MWRPLWFLSLWAVLAATPAHARWSVELRPLDTRPYTRSFEPLFQLHAKSGLSHLEGLGVELARGETVLFDVPLMKEARPRQLELHVGYLTPDQAPRQPAACAVSLMVDTGEARQVDLTVPLRSIEPRSLPMEQLRARYDYLTPQVTAGLPAGATRLKVTARVEGECAAGRLVVMDPKVWRRESGEPPKRLIFIPADSISGDWFEQDRHFMPTVEQFFSRPGARLNTNVVSVSTNTHDTTNILSKMAFELRDGNQINGSPRSPGLVPAFLDAGYEVLSFNSNLLLSTVWQPSGFRYLFNLHTLGTPLNDQHGEVLGDMMIDWLKRHPDHDVFLYGWHAATHSSGTAPRTRPDFPADKLLAGPDRVPAYARERVLKQARAMSYTDLALERFLREPLVESSDVLFFSDHGMNFATLYHDLPLWGRCVRKTAPSNWHIAPEELRVPVGLRVHGYDPGPISFETSLLDWVYTAVTRHNPKLAAYSFEGKDLSQAKPGELFVAVSHGWRGAIRKDGKHVYFEDACEGHGTVLFLDSGKQPVPSDQAVWMASVLASKDVLRRPYGKMTLEVFHGGPECSVEVKLPPAVLQSGGPAPASIRVDPTRWHTRLELYSTSLPGLRSGVSIESSRPECAELQAGYVRMKLPGKFQLQGSGLEPLMRLQGPDVTPGAATVIRPLVVPGEYTRDGKNFVTQDAVAPTRAAPLSKELRAAMKRWGYIQDDQPGH